MSKHNPADVLIQQDQYWMQLALKQAQLSATEGEVPVGAVLVYEQELVAVAGNKPIQKNDPTAHAEIRVIRAACERIQNYRLPGTTLYVTLEPCPMCAGAMLHARVQRLVFAAFDPRSGASGSVMDIVRHATLNHRLEVQEGILEAESRSLLQGFFRQRRKAIV